jgi:guanylate kinase
MRKGKYIVITGPSGSGKTTVSGILLERLPSVARLVTTTTRAPREKERDGIDYHFVTTPEFLAMIERGEFLEHADVYGKHYGSTRAEVLRLCALYDVVIGVLDVQGARATKDALPETVTVCLTAPLPQLHARLSRRSNKPGELERRMKDAEHEMSLSSTFDHTVACTDGSLDLAAGKVMDIALQR